MTTTHSPRFIPLSPISQNKGKSVLYYDSQVSPEAAVEYIDIRIDAIINLFKDLKECKNNASDAMPAICTVSKLVINDAILLTRALKAKTTV